MSEKDKKEANEKIAQCLAKAEAALQEAEDLADKHGVTFGWHRIYGMGGRYLPKGSVKDNYYSDEPDTREVGEWISSSSGC
jgi:hypothetical protein